MSRPLPGLLGAELAARASSPVSLALLLLGLTGCGVGTAAAVGSSGAGSASNAPPVVSDVLVGTDEFDAGTSPVSFSFKLTDAESDPVDVDVLYTPPGGGAPVPLVLIGDTNLDQLAAAPAGSPAHVRRWDFASQLPSAGAYSPGYRITVRARDLASSAESVLFGVGNDAPVVSDLVVPTGETVGIVSIELTLSDSSSDLVSVRVAYDDLDDPTGWKPATSAGGSLVNVTTTPEGVHVFFFWDAPADEPHAEFRAVLRFTPEDPVGLGTPALTGECRVDNNSAPILQLHEGAFLSNPDTVRGVPVPFTVIDAESDEITVVFQWRREGEGFPALPSAPAAIQAILADEDLRRQHHVCSAYPRRFEGRAVQLDATHVRLPELAGELSFLAGGALDGRDLEILRPKTGLAPVSADWDPNPLVHPVAALPLHGGTHALVLDESRRGSWALVRVRLLDGDLESTVATGTGAPTVLCFERDEASVLVASSVAGAWQVTRVVLASGATTVLVDHGAGPVERGSVRGIASLGTDAAVLTVGSSLVRVDGFESGAPRALAVRADLATPWGVVVDPRDAGWVLVAENSAPGTGAPGRVVAVELATRALRPVVVLPGAADGLAFARPRGLALQSRGTRLLAVCETDPIAGRVELRSVGLGRGDTSSALRLGPLLDAGTSTLSAGAGDDLLIATSGPGRLVQVAGGVERRVAIEGVDPLTATATLASSVAPPLDPASRWKVALSGGDAVRVASSPTGRAQSFLWNSADAPGGGNVFLKATPLDTDIGTLASSTGAKAVSPAFGSEQEILDGGGNPRSVVAADLDADGDLDLVLGNTCNFIDPPCDDRLKVFWQSAPGTFELDPTTLGSSTVTDNPATIVAADLDGDGDLDLVSANQGNNTLTVFWMVSPRVFGPVPTTLIVPGPVVGPEVHYPYFVVQAADLDGDGALDLVCTNEGSDTLAVFRQERPGTFDPTPTFVGGAGVTPGPIDVEAADLDGDGDLDLVSANLFGGTLTVFWQTVAGEFDPLPTTLNVPVFSAGPGSVQAADLDGDGDLDLACATVDTSLLAVFWQKAPGIFDPVPTTMGGNSVSGGAAFVQAADLDGDGDLDLVSGNIGAENLTVFWQVTPGDFDPLPTVVGVHGLTSGIDVRVADLDGDGDLDLLSMNSGAGVNTFGIFWQTAPGEFESVPTEMTGLLVEIRRPFDVQAADLDGDGDLDLVSANIASHTLSVFWQSSPGAFDLQPTVLGGSSTTVSPDSVQAADLDQDGDLDLVCANRDGHDLTVFWQTAPGVFDPVPTSVGGTSTTPNPYSVLATDLDGDGALDLVSANDGSSDLRVFWQSSRGGFALDPTPLGGPSTTFNPRFVQAADLDGDGDLDLVSANFGGGGSLTVFWQTASRTFHSVPTVVGGGSTSSGAVWVEAEDLDGDGALDLVSANQSGSNVSVFRGTGSGTFDPTPTVLGDASVTLNPVAVRAADVDGDGDLDLISANRGDSRLTVFWQIAPGRFDPIPTVISLPGSNSQPTSILPVDVDADGDLDLVTDSWNFHQLWVFRRLH